MTRVVTEELVLVVPRAVVIPGGRLARAPATGDDRSPRGHRPARTFQPRPGWSEDPAFKQVIPYLVLRDGDR